MATQYKLTYFKLRGRCEHIRYIFAAGEKPFEDKRIEKEEWPELKPKTPYGGLPILEVDGRIIAESTCVARYAAKECGLAGKNKIDEAVADSIVETCIEFREKHLIPFFFMSDEDKKNETSKDIMENKLPKMFTDFTGILKDKQFFVGDEMTWADIVVYYIIEMLGPFATAADAYPTIRALEKRVGESPGIAKYIKERPETPY